MPSDQCMLLAKDKVCQESSDHYEKAVCNEQRQ